MHLLHVRSVHLTPTPTTTGTASVALVVIIIVSVVATKVGPVNIAHPEV
jgi:hypothetical protein